MNFAAVDEHVADEDCGLHVIVGLVATSIIDLVIVAAVGSC